MRCESTHDIADLVLSIDKVACAQLRQPQTAARVQTVIYDYACGLAQHLDKRLPGYLHESGKLSAATHEQQQHGPSLLIPRFHQQNHGQGDCLQRRRLLPSLRGEAAEQHHALIKKCNSFVTQYKLINHFFMVRMIDSLVNSQKACE